jgi:AAA+ ATPase superfamily predicted ATPase
VAQNPFSYGSPVADPHFAGRGPELDALISRIENGINVVVTAPRRYGKTSLLNRAADRVAASGGSILRDNLLRIPSLEALAGRLASEAYLLSAGPWRRAAQTVPEFLKRLRLRPTVTFDDAGKPQFMFVAETTGPPGAEQLIEDVYRILAEVAKKGPSVLMLDEFQAVADLSPRLPELLKALSDEHPRVSVILAGSRKHLMETLVLDQNAPLYNMAERLALGPIEDAVMTQYLRSRARSGGKIMTPAVATAICDLSGPVPHDIQRLAYEVFDEAGQQVTTDSVEVGMSRVVAHEAEGYADRFSKFALGQRRVLMVLATQEIVHPQSAQFARVTGYANPGAARKAIRVLEDDETVMQRSGVYEIADPFFREWLRKGL